MVDIAAGFMIRGSMFILILSTVNGQKLRHNRSSLLPELHHRFLYPNSELSKHAYQTVDENTTFIYWRRYPNLFRVRNKVTHPKTTTTTVSAVIMMPWLPTTEHPFRTDPNGTLDDGFVPETPVKSVENLDWDNVVDNEWDGSSKKQAPLTSTTPIIATASTQLNHHHHHYHHTTVKIASTQHHSHQRVPDMHFKVKPGSETRKLEEKKIIEHIRRINEEAKCRLPRPKVIRVSDVHPHTSKLYNPHCTIIHQCDSDTGCCDDEKKVCSPKNTERVYLPFFIADGRNQSNERLEFINHTECGCHFRNLSLIQDATPQPTKQPPPPAPLCPSTYSVRYLSDGTCICDCFHLDKNCLTFKKGKTAFSIADQKCIRNGTCLLPSCEYGHYLRQHGRCVKRAEMFHHWPKFTVYDNGS